MIKRAIIILWSLSLLLNLGCQSKKEVGSVAIIKYVSHPALDERVYA
jgi:ABC-type uncharacterized transport system substrate-binding protein